MNSSIAARGGTLVYCFLKNSDLRVLRGNCRRRAVGGVVIYNDDFI